MKILFESLAAFAPMLPGMIKKHKIEVTHCDTGEEQAAAFTKGEQILLRTDSDMHTLSYEANGQPVHLIVVSPRGLFDLEKLGIKPKKNGLT